ncbi:MAG: 5-(carboxyamino)imidazole ribonucleotide synthase [Saprospiraceae bacterium]|nr:5-(carboxyamino)imidazole ribonucleotide synthase [Saprospiraceae bacterium]MBK7795183.1 5-(carboxyamino)imidazole ribonucleotide synthase [Saprospiraceae bacterium]MBK9377657.1 5-(carboxyamino)imidazole ribonucleotide synthase [Saprospiraceae bacterium]MBL0261930.1 5-(carboxyamino)imidazole ribonucleotide synthase [Saprospiraceae bacterium]
MVFSPSIFTIGVLGGGQLGKMLAMEAMRLDLNIKFLDPVIDAPVSGVCSQFVLGDFCKKADILSFAEGCKVLTIEREDILLEALEDLEIQGVNVYPQASILRIVVDKLRQKEYFLASGFDSAPFFPVNGKADIKILLESSLIQFPFVQKKRQGGFDGRGVKIVRSEEDLQDLLEGPCIVEAIAQIVTEISVIVCRDALGRQVVYEPVSMDFHPEGNMVEFLVCPADLPPDFALQAKAIALSLSAKLEHVGLLAVEMFWNKDSSIWINEIALRPHNSGHHTLDDGSVSQFENHLRAICGLPLGSTEASGPSIMINLLGSEGHTGLAQYIGMDEVMIDPHVHIHLYGKTHTKPHRKMGHVTITGTDLAAMKSKANWVKQTLRVISSETN